MASGTWFTSLATPRPMTGERFSSASTAAEGPDREHWMEAEVFATLFNGCGVRLVVMNCCRAASVYGNRGSQRAGTVLAPQRHSGRHCDASTARPIPPHCASLTNSTACSSAAEPGRVDQALEKARVVIYQNQTDRTVRDFVTPVLYLAAGHERVFVLDQPSNPVVKRLGSSAACELQKLPEDLIAALLEGRCVPVLGPGLLAAWADRDESPPLGLRDLALQLAMESSYRSGKMFEIASEFGPWIDSLLFQWVCQHFRSQKKIRFKLFNTIQQSFSKHKPTPLFRAWRRGTPPATSAPTSTASSSRPFRRACAPCK